MTLISIPHVLPAQLHLLHCFKLLSISDRSNGSTRPRFHLIRQAVNCNDDDSNKSNTSKISPSDPPITFEAANLLVSYLSWFLHSDLQTTYRNSIPERDLRPIPVSIGVTQRTGDTLTRRHTVHDRSVHPSLTSNHLLEPDLLLPAPRPAHSPVYILAKLATSQRMALNHVQSRSARVGQQDECWFDGSVNSWNWAF